MFVRIHRNESDVILAACDEDLIGRSFADGRARLDVSEIFYRGESLDRAALAERMRNASIMNLVGSEAVAVAIEEGYVSEEDVIEIAGIKHVQVVLM